MKIKEREIKLLFTYLCCLLFTLSSCKNQSSTATTYKQQGKAMGHETDLTILYSQEAVEFIQNYGQYNEYYSVKDELKRTFDELAGIQSEEYKYDERRDKRAHIYSVPYKKMRIGLTPQELTSQVFWITDLIIIDNNTILICKIKPIAGMGYLEQITEDNESIIQAQKDLADGKVVPHKMINWE